MGGATSKLEENDWSKADGKLRGSEFTLDGSEALPGYGVYYLTKRGVNQREFDVTDEESNLLFTTKQVPGTIACFDVSARIFFHTGIGVDCSCDSLAMASNLPLRQLVTGSRKRH